MLCMNFQAVMNDFLINYSTNKLLKCPSFISQIKNMIIKK